MPKHIVLASQSPRRKQLLDQLGLKYKIVPSNIEEIMPESIDENSSAEQIASELARQKAFAVSTELQKRESGLTGEWIILGADTIVVLDNKLYGKPNSSEEAKEMLNALRGRTHQVYTGLSLLYFDFDKSAMQCLSECEMSSVGFRDYTEAEIDAYISTGEPMDKAGAYALQGIGACLIAKIEGCYTNVIGLPLPKTLKMLRTVGVEVLGQ